MGARRASRSDGAVWGSGPPHCAALDPAGAAWTMTGRGSRDPSGSLPEAAGPPTLSRSADGRSGVTACGSTCIVTSLPDVYGRRRTETNETTTETVEDH